MNSTSTPEIQIFYMDSEGNQPTDHLFWTRQDCFVDKKAKYFYDNVLPHEDPWTNEKEGTKRIAASEKTDTQIYLSPFNWYHTVCLKGKLTELGSALNEQAKNS